MAQKPDQKAVQSEQNPVRYEVIGTLTTAQQAYLNNLVMTSKLKLISWQD